MCLHFDFSLHFSTSSNRFSHFCQFSLRPSHPAYCPPMRSLQPPYVLETVVLLELNGCHAIQLLAKYLVSGNTRHTISRNLMRIIARACVCAHATQSHFQLKCKLKVLYGMKRPACTSWQLFPFHNGCGNLMPLAYASGLRSHSSSFLSPRFCVALYRRWLHQPFSIACAVPVNIRDSFSQIACINCQKVNLLLRLTKSHKSTNNKYTANQSCSQDIISRISRTHICGN